MDKTNTRKAEVFRKFFDNALGPVEIPVKHPEKIFNSARAGTLQIQILIIIGEILFRQLQIQLTVDLIFQP